MPQQYEEPEAVSQAERGPVVMTPAALPADSGQHEGLSTPVPEYRHPKKNFRLKQKAVPQWYKARAGVRTRTQSGAARVARFRPRSRPVQ